MSFGLIGYKCGMTRIFTELGESIPVTVLRVPPNYVTQVKTIENDGYRSLQMTAGEKRASRISKPILGQFAKASVTPGKCLREFRLNEGELLDAKMGDVFNVDLFKEGQTIDVRSASRGKGYQGGVKRHNFKMQDATHGNSVSHRALGSTGQCQTPGRVLKGKKMAGQMGNAFCTAVNQKIVQIDLEAGVILVKGSVPGAPGGEVIVTLSSRSKGDK